MRNRLPLKELREALCNRAPGPVDPAPVLALLRACWPNLGGADQARMHAGKLTSSRVENPEWTGRELRFDIARHGAMALGSSRSNVQTWAVDVDAGTATIIVETKRQDQPQDKRLAVAPLAAEVARSIIAGANEPRLRWGADGSVVVNIARVIPTTNRETTASRRKRFREALNSALRETQWRELRANKYART